MVLKTSRFNLVHRQDEPVIYLIDLFAGAGGIHTGYSSVYDWFDDIKLALTAIIS